MLRHRDSLIRAIVARRHKCLCLVPGADDDERRRFAGLGAEVAIYDPHPKGFPLLENRRAEALLAELLRDWRVHAVMGSGVRPLTLAARAAHMASVERIVGLCNDVPDSAFDPHQPGSVSLRRFRSALASCHAAVFHNGDDLRRVQGLGLMPPGLWSIVVPGAGVDLEQFQPTPTPPLGSGLVFLMIADLDRRRGVHDYAAAARALKAETQGSRFLLAGDLVEGPGAVRPEAIGCSDGTLEYLGSIDDVRPALARCHVYVYPSYGEGMPRSVLEALAAGRPVITTRTPGCRETVDEVINGRLVTAGDRDELVAAMGAFLSRPDQVVPAGRASRAKAERQFDVRNVNRSLMAVLDLD